MQLRHGPDTKIIFAVRDNPPAGRTVQKNQDSTASVHCRFGRLRATRSQITVQWHPAEITASASVSCRRQLMRRNSFLFCVSSVNPASFHPIDSGRARPRAGHREACEPGVRQAER